MRIVHKPTGIRVEVQEERSQLQNREKAMRYLRARLHQMAIDEAQAKEAAQRKAQLGSGERSEKIRTYNFPEGRVTDHRIKQTSYQLADVLAGGEELDGFIDALQAAERAQQLADDAGLMRPAEVIRRGAAYLERHGVESPDANAERLMMRVLGAGRTALLARTDGLSAAEARAYGKALCLRCTGTPLQHLTREQGFRRLVLEVRPGVFVPRPETEVVAGVALERITSVRTPAIVDLGTGSGAIALALRDERPDARVWATDLSPDAVELARVNATRLGLDVDVRVGDLFDRALGRAPGSHRPRRGEPAVRPDRARGRAGLRTRSPIRRWRSSVTSRSRSGSWTRRSCGCGPAGRSCRRSRRTPVPRSSSWLVAWASSSRPCSPI